MYIMQLKIYTYVNSTGVHRHRRFLTSDIVETRRFVLCTAACNN